MKNVALNFKFVASILMLLLLSGCFQGRKSSKPPIHLNPNMDKQEKYKAQEKSMFFENGSVNRMPIEGTIARGDLHEDTRYYYGKENDGRMIKTIPMAVTMELLERGQERFDIYCSPCHGKTGEGNGIVVQRGLIQPTSFFDKRLMAEPVGQIFEVMTNGKNNMPAYKSQIPVEDRWAIVAYFRALQKSRSATKKDIPANVLEGLN